MDPHDIRDWVAPDAVRRISTKELEQMVRLGMFQNERVELLRGLLVEMTPPGPDHDEAVTRFNEWLVVALAGRARVRPGCAFAALADSVPLPDIAVAAARDYSSAWPDRALLVIEVSNTSLRKDRLLKASLYAEAGVPEYWIANLADRQVEIHRDPDRGHYRTVTTASGLDEIAPRAFPGVARRVADLIP